MIIRKNIINNRTHIRTHERGQVLMLSILLLSLAFSLATFLSGSIILYQIRAASEITSAMVAIFAGDSGIQCELYEQIKDPAFVCPPSNPSPYMTNAASYEIFLSTVSSTPTTSSTIVLRSKGKFRDTARSLEASF